MPPPAANHRSHRSLGAAPPWCSTYGIDGSAETARRRCIKNFIMRNSRFKYWISASAGAAALAPLQPVCRQLHQPSPNCRIFTGQCCRQQFYRLCNAAVLESPRLLAISSVCWRQTMIICDIQQASCFCAESGCSIRHPPDAPCFTTHLRKHHVVMGMNVGERDRRDAIPGTWGSTYAGLRLAKALRPARSASSPLSGRCSAGRVSHLYL